MNWKLMVLAVSLTAFVSCGGDKKKDENKDDAKKETTTPQQDAEKYCKCQSDMETMMKDNSPELEKVTKECTEFEKEITKKYMSDEKAQEAFMKAYMACMPQLEIDSMAGDSMVK